LGSTDAADIIAVHMWISNTSVLNAVMGKLEGRIEDFLLDWGEARDI